MSKTYEYYLVLLNIEGKLGDCIEVLWIWDRAKLLDSEGEAKDGTHVPLCDIWLGIFLTPMNRVSSISAFLINQMECKPVSSLNVTQIEGLSQVNTNFSFLSLAKLTWSRSVPSRNTMGTISSRGWYSENQLGISGLLVGHFSKISPNLVDQTLWIS